jgi:dihydroorotase
VLSLGGLIEKLSVNPRRILHLPNIVIEEGQTANLTIFDPIAEWTVDPLLFKSRSRNTPFSGRHLAGRPVGVLNNGRAYWS